MLGKRTMDFKVTYLDSGLTSSYLNEGDLTPSTNGQSSSSIVTKVPKRYKTHLRDFLSSSRGKRKNTNSNSSQSAAAAAAAAANANNVAADIYSDTTNSIASVYGQGNYQYAAAAAAAAESPLYLQQQNPYQSIYNPVENRYTFPSEYLASYSRLTSYYPEYAAPYSYFDPAAPRPLTSIQYDAASQLRYFEQDKTGQNQGQPHQGTIPHGGGVATGNGGPGECKYSIVDGLSSIHGPIKNNMDKSKEDDDKGVKCEPINVVGGFEYNPTGVDHTQEHS